MENPSPPLAKNINFVAAKSLLDWDEYFMLQAMAASFKSKDPHTKVGCVFVDANNHQVSMGYNGFVAGIDETQLPWGREDSVPLEMQKYGYVVHAEANAILHAPRSLAGSRLYVTLFPCQECAKLVSSVKAKEIIYLSDKHCSQEGNRIAKRIFDLSGISYRQLSLKESMITELQNHFLKMINDA